MCQVMYKASSAFMMFIGNYQLKKWTRSEDYPFKKVDVVATGSK